MDSKYPLVTVFTLIYNTNPKYIIEAIESVRDNNYPNLQHIIVDDCSPNPHPKEALKEWIKKEEYDCEFYEHQTNFGICRTLNHVLELAKGKYMLGCSDDRITSDRIIKDVEILEKLGEKYALIFGMSQEMDSNSKLKYNVFPKLRETPEDDNYFNVLLSKNIFATPSITLRTQSVRDVGGYDTSLKYEDYDLWLNLSCNGYKFAQNCSISSYYRVHSDSASATMAFHIEDIKCLLKYAQIALVRTRIDTRMIELGLGGKYSEFREAFDLIRRKYKPSLLVYLSGMKIHRVVKKLIIHFWKRFE